jgi:ribosome maturation factor RimP
MARASAQIHAIIEPAVTALGFELVGVEHLTQGRHSLLRVYIDHPDGVDVDDCADASHQISAVLDVEDPIRGDYTLEVSSPGLDRPLFNEAQFARYIGKLAEVRLRVAQQGRRRFRGRLLEVEDGRLRIEVDGVEYELMLDNVDKAHLIHEW